MSYLWRHVERSSHFRVGLDGLGAEDAAQPEVADLEGAVGGDENVGRLQIAVHDALIVHVRECAGDLHDVVPKCDFLERSVVLLRAFDELFQIAPFRPFGCDDELVVEDEGIEIFDDIGVIKRLHELDFFEALLSLLRVHHVEDLSI